MNTNDNRIALLGVPVENLTMDTTVDRIFSMINRYAFDAVSRHVVTANVDFLVKANRKNSGEGRELMTILRRADLVTADGMPLVWLSRMLGHPLAERVTGADLVPALAARAAVDRRSVYLLGGKPGAAERSARILEKNNPGLKIAGWSAPFVRTDFKNDIERAENDRLVEEINRSGAHILFIALGNPKQEIWFHRNRHALRIPVSIGIGGTFEFIAGMTSRAPEWVQNSGFEWVYRTLQEPRRMVKRYVEDLYTFGRMTLPLLSYQLLTEVMQSVVWSQQPSAALADSSSMADARRIDMQDSYRSIISSFVRKNGTLTLDLRDRCPLSQTELAELIELVHSAAEEGMSTQILHAGSWTRLGLQMNRVSDMFEPGYSALAENNSHTGHLKVAA